MKEKIGALIVASLNYEDGVLYPLLPLDGTSVIKYEIFLLRRAGLRNITVLGGYEAEQLKTHVSHNHVDFLIDSEYKNHSFFESIASVWDTICESYEKVIIFPVDYSTFSIETVKTMMEEVDHSICVSKNRTGFPWLLKTEKELFEKYGEQLLKRDYRISSVSQCLPFKKIPVSDEGILYSISGNGMDIISNYLAMRKTNTDLRIKTKVILSKELDFFGPGIYKLLIKIQETGSIQAASHELNMSYSKAWKMVNKVEKEMGFQFLTRTNGGKKGGSSVLTEEGLHFLDRYRVLERDLIQISQNLFELYFREFL